MKKMVWVIGVLILLAVAGCANDPSRAADAQATILRAQQDAANQQAAREQKAASAALILAEKQAQSEQWVASWNSFVRWIMLIATISSALVILSTGTGVSWAVIGIGRAAAIAAENKALQIPMNPESGMFPVVKYLGKGIVALTDINTGKTVHADTRNEADRQMIAAAFAVRLNSAVAWNARKAKDSDSAGVAMVGTHPVIVGAKDGNLEVGEFVTVEEDHAN